MKLHMFPDEFKELVPIVAADKHIPESAVVRDYYIVLMLKALADSPYAEQCVFKGGTSLSKCYPGSIERFSEDIDLTFLGMELPDKECDRVIKKLKRSCLPVPTRRKFPRNDPHGARACMFGSMCLGTV